MQLPIRTQFLVTHTGDNIFAKSKEVKPGWSNSTQIWQNILREIMAKKWLFC
jgi:hypothetical protein